MKRKVSTYRLSDSAHNWLTEQSKKRGISKNDVIQELINKAKESEAAPK